MKKYLIKEEQYKRLIQLKRDEKIANKIVEEIKLVQSKLNENTLRQSGLVSIIKKYRKKGHLSEGVIKILSELKINIRGII